MIKRIFPFLDWFSGYNLGLFKGGALAGRQALQRRLQVQVRGRQPALEGLPSAVGEVDLHAAPGLPRPYPAQRRGD